ncbi:peptidase C15, pyroglutamyl peptidase I-like protein, partial [Lepidopterella palustris CBS 459.81]
MSRAWASAVPQPEPEKVEETVTVLVTGFGPFLSTHPINPSWSIASTLPATLPATKTHRTPIQISIHPHPIRVSYKTVISLIPSLLSPSSQKPGTPTPDIVLHLGLAAGRKFYALERGAHRDGYDSIPDVDGETFPPETTPPSKSCASTHSGTAMDMDTDTIPETHSPHASLPPILNTSFNTAAVLQHCLSLLPDTNYSDVRLSEDAGNFMCGFIYYNSLAHFYKKANGGERPVMFLHVPNLPTEEDIKSGREVACALIRALVESWRKDGKGK